MTSTTASWQKAPLNARARLPWPLPLSPQRIRICASPLASYSIALGVEAWDKADPRAVAFFRCQRHARGRAFADTLLLQRVPLAGLAREGAAAIFARLSAWLRGRAAVDRLLEVAS